MVAYARAAPRRVTISQPSALRMLDDVELVTLPPPEFQIDQILVTLPPPEFQIDQILVTLPPPEFQIDQILVTLPPPEFQIDQILVTLPPPEFQIDQILVTLPPPEFQIDQILVTRGDQPPPTALPCGSSILVRTENAGFAAVEGYAPRLRPAIREKRGIRPRSAIASNGRVLHWQSQTHQQVGRWYRPFALNGEKRSTHSEPGETMAQSVGVTLAHLIPRQVERRYRPSVRIGPRVGPLIAALTIFIRRSNAQQANRLRPSDAYGRYRRST